MRKPSHTNTHPHAQTHMHAHTQRHTHTQAHTHAHHTHTEQTRTNTHKHALTHNTPHTHYIHTRFHTTHTNAHTHHTHTTQYFFRLKDYQIVPIIRLRVYQHSFIATVYSVTVAIKDCDKLVVSC